VEVKIIEISTQILQVSAANLGHAPPNKKTRSTFDFERAAFALRPFIFQNQLTS
jgi:hypothetical protein